MDENNNKLEYNVRQRAKAGTAATFRGIVAVYIAYLGYRLIRGRGDGTSSLPVWAHWVIGLAFIAAALGFAYYAWKRWHIDVEAARIREDEEAFSDDEPEELTDDEEEESSEDEEEEPSDDDPEGFWRDDPEELLDDELEGPSDEEPEVLLDDELEEASEEESEDGPEEPVKEEEL